MNNNEIMMKMAKKYVTDYYNKHIRGINQNSIESDDVLIVWFCKTLQNWKALVSTTVSDGRYYEITHNGDKKETYFDVYKKIENIVISD